MTNMREFSVALYKAVDSMDTKRFAEFLAPDAEFAFGNSPPVKGREAIAAYSGAFLAMIAGIRHEILDVWSSGDALFLRQLVTYTRKDGKQVQLPAANILLLKDGLIQDYRIYMDVAPVFA